MRIGIMADNHGRLQTLQCALQVFARRGVDALIHCGDIGGLETLEALAGWRAWFVWGNTDFPERSWRAAVSAWNINWPDEIPVKLLLDDQNIAVCHGHESVFRHICTSGEYDYVFHGHTHAPEDRQEGTTRIINPGALHRTSRRTVAVLEAGSGELEFIDVPLGRQT